MRNTQLGRVWIAGADGRVAREFVKLLDTRETELFLTDREDRDVSDADSVNMFAEMNRPDVIINCAGITDVQLCETEPELAYRVNALGARNLAVAARRVNARIVQLSTDDVFDGKTDTYYSEFDQPAPFTVYGKSKLAGENFVKDLAPKHLIIRSSWVYGEGKNFVNDLLESARGEKEILVPENQVAAPTSALEVAKCILRLLTEEAYGTYHAVCSGSCSRYEFAAKILQLAGLEARIIPAFSDDLPDISMRPARSVLYNMMLRISCMETPVSWQEALETYIRSLKN